MTTTVLFPQGDGLASWAIIACMLDPRQTELLRLLTIRLERLSADSRWARRASGLRGNLLKILEAIESGQRLEPARLELLIDKAFEILRQAAHEIPDLEALRKKP